MTPKSTPILALFFFLSTAAFAGPVIDPGLQACEGDLFAVARPSTSGLVGSINYNFFSNCETLSNPSASITVTSTLDGGTNGFDFQLNANAYATSAYPNGATSSGGPGRVGWQQYIINIKPGSVPGTTDVWADINNWPTSVAGKYAANGSDLINTQAAGVKFYLVTLVNPKNVTDPTLPAGTVVTITLNTDPSTNNVTGATFDVQLPASASTINIYSNYYNNQEISLIGLPLASSLCVGGGKTPWPDKRYCPNGPSSLGAVTADDTGPVTDFELDVISQSTGSIFPSGAGIITYAAAGERLVPAVPAGSGSYSQWYHPSCSTGVLTAETSNVGYSTVPSCTTGNSPVQTFESRSPAASNVTSACSAWTNCMSDWLSSCFATVPYPVCPLATNTGAVDEGPVCHPSPTQTCPVVGPSAQSCDKDPSYLAAMANWIKAQSACQSAASKALAEQACAPAASNYWQQAAACTSFGCSPAACPGIPAAP